MAQICWRKSRNATIGLGRVTDFSFQLFVCSNICIFSCLIRRSFTFFCSLLRRCSLCQDLSAFRPLRIRSIGLSSPLLALTAIRLISVTLLFNMACKDRNFLRAYDCGTYLGIPASPTAIVNLGTKTKGANSCINRSRLVACRKKIGPMKTRVFDGLVWWAWKFSAMRNHLFPDALQPKFARGGFVLQFKCARTDFASTLKLTSKGLRFWTKIRSRNLSDRSSHSLANLSLCSSN